MYLLLVLLFVVTNDLFGHNCPSLRVFSTDYNVSLEFVRLFSHLIYTNFDAFDDGLVQGCH